MVATFSLTNCTEEMDQPVEAGKVPYTIYASAADTKTVNDGFSTTWAEKDALTVFHAQAGTEAYSGNSRFTLVDVATNKFATEDLQGELADVNDWYVLYPYVYALKTPKPIEYGYTEIGSRASGKQTQNGNNSMAHIAGAYYPMWGIAKGVSGDNVPDITMTHVSSLLEVVVKNSTEEALTVTSVSLTAEENIVGTYFIDFSTEKLSFKGSGDNYVAKTAKLTVNDGEPIAVGKTAKFYLAIKPFTATSGQKLTLNVNGIDKVKILSADVTFSPGKIKTLNFDYDYMVKPMEPLSGDYVVVAENDGEYYAMSSEADGTSRLAYVTLDSFDPTAASYMSDDKNLRWNIQASGNQYVIKNTGNSKYLSYDETKTNYVATAEEAYPVTITQIASKYNITILDGVRILAKNANAKYGFAFYETDGTTGYKDLYLVHVIDDTREQLATPQNVSAVATGNSIEVSWGSVANATSYDVTCGDQTKNVTALSCTFEDLSYSTAYSISVVAKAAAYKSSVAGTTEVTTEANVNAVKYELVKDISDLAVGDKIVIVASATNVALSTTQNANNRGQADVTKEGETVSVGDDVQVLTLESGNIAGTWALNTGTGYLYAAGGTGKNNYLKTYETLADSGCWTIEITPTGVATIKAPSTVTRNWMRHNASNRLFSCYASGQADISIYKLAN